MSTFYDIEVIELIMILLIIWLYMAIASFRLYGSRNGNSNRNSAYYNAFWGIFITLGILSLVVIIVYWRYQEDDSQ